MLRPRNTDDRRKAERQVRAAREAGEAAAAAQNAVAATIASVREILADWDDLVIECKGGIWSVDGYFHARRHLGARAEPLSLANDLAAAARLERDNDEANAQRAAEIGRETAARVEEGRKRERRMAEMEARLAELEGRPLASPPAAPAEPIVIERLVDFDPLDPSQWRTLEEAKAALLVLVKREAARRVGYEVTLYERMTALDARVAGDIATRDEELELQQHESWASARTAVEEARQAHAAAIMALTQLEDARLYRWDAGWPEI